MQLKGDHNLIILSLFNVSKARFNESDTAVLPRCCYRLNLQHTADVPVTDRWSAFEMQKFELNFQDSLVTRLWWLAEWNARKVNTDLHLLLNESS